jgi:type IV secretory pathway ATPase VirB11/archaellum biosynthesis ATPase
VPEALRQNLSRLVVGEVRGGEAATMFEAMQAGAGAGELCTTPTPSRSYPRAERYPVPAR